jgi:TPR repeat protein
MKKHIWVLAALGLVLATPAWADRAAGMQALTDGDYPKALSELQPLAEKGDMESQFDLATMYDTGKGVPLDPAKAFVWYERAAKQGQKAAQFNLGVMFEDAIGVPKDLVQAYLYYSLAVNGGPPYAARNLSQIRRDMTPEQIAKAEQLVLDFKPVIEH